MLPALRATLFPMRHENDQQDPAEQAEHTGKQLSSRIENHHGNIAEGENQGGGKIKRIRSLVGIITTCSGHVAETEFSSK